MSNLNLRLLTFESNTHSLIYELSWIFNLLCNLRRLNVSSHYVITVLKQKFYHSDDMDRPLGSSFFLPLNPANSKFSLPASDTQNFRADMFGRIDEGFFIGDKDWTCYRRNYFSLNCLFSIRPALPTATMKSDNSNIEFIPGCVASNQPRRKPTQKRVFPPKPEQPRKWSTEQNLAERWTVHQRSKNKQSGHLSAKRDVQEYVYIGCRSGR